MSFSLSYAELFLTGASSVDEPAAPVDSRPPPPNTPPEPPSLLTLSPTSLTGRRTHGVAFGARPVRDATPSTGRSPATSPSGPYAGPSQAPSDPLLYSFEDRALLDEFSRSLGSGAFLRAEDIAPVITLVTMRPGWPHSLCVRYEDPHSTPPITATLPDRRDVAVSPRAIEIQRLANGAYICGPRCMPPDLRPCVPDAPEAVLDALMTGTRLLTAANTRAAITTLLAGTPYQGTHIQRQCTADGRPAGTYLQALLAIRLQLTLEARVAVMRLDQRRFAAPPSGRPARS